MASRRFSITHSINSLCSSSLEEAEQPGAALHRPPVTVQNVVVGKSWTKDVTQDVTQRGLDWSERSVGEWSARLMSAVTGEGRREACVGIVSRMQALLPQDYSLTSSDMATLTNMIEGEIEAKQLAVSQQACSMVKSDILELRALREEREEFETRMMVMNTTYMREITAKRDSTRASSEVAREESEVQFYEPMQHLSSEARQCVHAIVEERVKAAVEGVMKESPSKVEESLLRDRLASYQRLNSQLQDELRELRGQERQTEVGDPQQQRADAVERLASELGDARRELQSVTEERDSAREQSRSLERRLCAAEEGVAAQGLARPSAEPSSFLKWRTSATARRSLLQAATGDLLEKRASDAERRAEESAEALRQRDEALRQRDEQALALTSQVESLTSQSEGLQRLLRQRNEQIVSEGEALQQRDEQIGSLTSQVESLTSQVESLTSQAESLQSLLRQRDEQIESLTSQLGERPQKSKEDMDLRTSILTALPDKYFGASKLGDDDAQTEVPDDSDSVSAMGPHMSWMSSLNVSRRGSSNVSLQSSKTPSGPLSEELGVSHQGSRTSGDLVTGHSLGTLAELPSPTCSWGLGALAAVQGTHEETQPAHERSRGVEEKEERDHAELEDAAVASAKGNAAGSTDDGIEPTLGDEASALRDQATAHKAQLDAVQKENTTLRLVQREMQQEIHSLTCRLREHAPEGSRGTVEPVLEPRPPPEGTDGPPVATAGVKPRRSLRLAGGPPLGRQAVPEKDATPEEGAPEDLRRATLEGASSEEAAEPVLGPSVRPRRSVRLAGGLLVKLADSEEDVPAAAAEQAESADRAGCVLPSTRGANVHEPPAHEPPAAIAGVRPRRSLRVAGGPLGRQADPEEARNTIVAVGEHLAEGPLSQRSSRRSATEPPAEGPLSQRSSRRSVMEPLPAEGPLSQRSSRCSATEPPAEGPLSQRSSRRSATEPLPAEGPLSLSSSRRLGQSGSALTAAGGAVLQIAERAKTPRRHYPFVELSEGFPW